MGHFVFNVSMISSKMSCSSIYVLFMSYQNLTWKCWDTTYVTSDCNFKNYCRLQYEASFFRKWRSQTYPKSWPKREKRKKKNPTKSKNKKPKQTNQPNRQFSKSVKGGGGVFTLILMLFFVFNLKLFYMLPKWWEELLQYLMFYM